MVHMPLLEVDPVQSSPSSASMADAPSTSSKDFLVNVEIYIPTPIAAAFGRRKKRHDLDSNLPPEVTRDTKKGKATLSRSVGGASWRSATGMVSEEGKRCLLNVYLDETLLFQTIFVHLLKHTDIRLVDNSLFFRPDCLAITCDSHQRWTSTPSSDPLYLHFSNTDTLNTWLALLRSYAVPELYGKSHFPSEGGSYRMWRQIDLSVVQGRNMGSAKSFLAAPSPTDPDGAPAAPSAEDAVDLDVFCEIQVNEAVCGRTTVKRGIGAPYWHESFAFPDLPPLENLDVVVWREKRFFKPAVLGTVRVTLGHFRRGDTVEGWFPVLHGGSVAAGLQVGEIKLTIRVSEEIILPFKSYGGLLQTLGTRNTLEWIADFEGKLSLNAVSTHMLSIAVARNTLLDHIFEYADREVDGTASSHNTLFRGNTTLTKVVEISMLWFGKAFLRASVGNVIYRVCVEKVAIEVDPVRSGKGMKEIEKGVELLIYWCKEFWNQIYAARSSCPNELRRIFQHLRKLVEKRYRTDDGSQDQKRELPWQCVSAFCFLRFIVPAILHPHLFGLSPGMPPAPVQRSLTLIAKVIQSLANLNPTVQREEFMRGVKNFLQENLPAMLDYIFVVSTSSETASAAASATAKNERSNIISSLRRRGASLPDLEREAIPSLPHLIDLPKHLAVVSSAILRNGKEYRLRTPTSNPAERQLENFCGKCFELEESALKRVSQIASRKSPRSPNPLQAESTSNAVAGGSGSRRAEKQPETDPA